MIVSACSTVEPKIRNRSIAFESVPVVPPSFNYYCVENSRYDYLGEKLGTFRAYKTFSEQGELLEYEVHWESPSPSSSQVNPTWPKRHILEAHWFGLQTALLSKKDGILSVKLTNTAKENLARNHFSIELQRIEKGSSPKRISYFGRYGYYLA